MAATLPQVWQVWDGPGGVFAETFIQHSILLVGPRGPGAWRPDRRDNDYLDDQGNGGKSIRWLAADVRSGDIVLLRRGLQEVRAIGVVAGGYEYFNDIFDDVSGWDLPHGVRVRWCVPHGGHEFGRVVFSSGHRFSRIHDSEARDYAVRFVASPPIAWQEAPLAGLPPAEPALTEIPTEIAALVALAQDLEGLYWSSEAFGGKPREDEVVAHFVVPLLRALGWQPERIAVKWNDVDIAVFDSLPRSPASCRFIIEAKRPGALFEGALGQARGYLADLGIVRDIVLTDGIRYYTFEAEGGFERVAYANLARLRGSAAELFARMRRP